jgi:hypothetical protein
VFRRCDIEGAIVGLIVVVASPFPDRVLCQECGFWCVAFRLVWGMSAGSAGSDWSDSNVAFYVTGQTLRPNPKS